MSFKVRLEILDQDDEVIGFHENRIAIKKKNGEVEIISLVYDENNIPRIEERSVLITFKSTTAAKTSIIDDSGIFEIGSF